MSYKITYGKPIPAEYAKRRKIWPICLLLVLCVSLTALFVFQDASAAVMEAIFPWTRPGVRNALSAMTEQIMGGVPVGDAVAAFCEEIVHGAQ